MHNLIISKLSLLSRTSKQIVIFVVDILVLELSIIIAYSIRYGEWYQFTGKEYWLLVLAPICAFPVLVVFGLYRAIIRYIEFKAVWAISQAVSFYAVTWGLLAFVLQIDGFPRSVIFLNWMLVLVFIIASRLFAKWLFSRYFQSGSQANKNVMIYGAGSAGIQLVSALKSDRGFNFRCFVDDDKKLHQQSILGIKVYSGKQISQLIITKKIDEVLIALPSISRNKRNKIIASLTQYPVLVRVLPGLSALASGKIQTQDLKIIEIKDLLGRGFVPPDPKLLVANIKNRVVLVTGAGGSIGSELCRQIIQNSPKKLVLFEQSEFALFEIEQELAKSSIDNSFIISILGTVTSKQKLETVCNKFRVQTIYHAAAYKHVPMVEHNIAEGVKNNIFGTLRCAEAAINSNVETFILISTDKAVRPTNIMGATKRVAELVLQALTETQNHTIFSMVRFGNVLGSSGSVIPHFDKQIKTGGPVTVTHPAIVRYFMTTKEASQLVIQAGAMADGGDVFVLDMGRPVKILDLAKKMINLSGLKVCDENSPDGDIEISFTGLRPGEKLYEELLIGDNTSGTRHPMIMRAEENKLGWHDLEKILQNLQESIEKNDCQRVIELLNQAVPEFIASPKIRDYLNLNP